MGHNKQQSNRFLKNIVLVYGLFLISKALTTHEHSLIHSLDQMGQIKDIFRLLDNILDSPLYKIYWNTLRFIHPTSAPCWTLAVLCSHPASFPRMLADVCSPHRKAAGQQELDPPGCPLCRTPPAALAMWHRLGVRCAPG